ncbi:MAG: DUF551 domain-containing protein, partial [Caulobacteraceae bacterium]|nr:DUF551 domain-containing protein [Caulobacteraceae bacterium]
RQGADAVERTQWQPIETAPRDGTRILIYSRSNNYGSSGKPTFDDFSVAHWGEITSKYSGWCGIVKGYTVSCREGLPYEHENPTHWMPLPEPPKETK